MKVDQLQGLDGAELQRQAQESQEQLFRFRFQMGMGQMEGLKKYRALKKDRARMLTVLNQKRASGEVIPDAPLAAVPAAKPKRRSFLSRAGFGRKKK